MRHEVNGLKAPFEDESRFLELALRAAGDRPLRQNLGEKALHTAQGLSWESIFSRLEHILISVVEDNEAYHEKALFGVELG